MSRLRIFNSEDSAEILSATSDHDEMARQLCGDMPGRRPMPREICKRGFALRHPAGRVDLAKEGVVTGLMCQREKHERAGLADTPLAARKSPARDDARQRGHIRLRVAAMNP